MRLLRGSTPILACAAIGSVLGATSLVCVFIWGGTWWGMAGSISAIAFSLAGVILAER